jgi:hypothetical protein
MPQVCTNCGNELPAKVLFCPNCHSDLLFRYAVVQFTPQVYGAWGQLTLADYQACYPEGQADQHMEFPVPVNLTFCEIIPISYLEPVVPGTELVPGCLVRVAKVSGPDSMDTQFLGAVGVFQRLPTVADMAFVCDTDTGNSPVVTMYSYQL